MPETDKLFPRLREPKCFVDRPVPSELSAALERLAGLLGDLCGLSDSGDPYFVVQNRARTALDKLGWTPREEPPVCPTCGGSMGDGFCDDCAQHYNDMRPPDEEPDCQSKER